MELVTYHVESRIAYLTLNRPEKRNALNPEMVAALREAFARAEKDPAKVIVLRANGKVFCSGADLDSLAKLQHNSFAENITDSNHLKALFLQMYTHPKPIVAEVHGHAIAGGCGLAAVCDFVYAAPAAKMGYTEVRIGFVPAIVMVFLLRKLGEGYAKELLLSGDLITAERAHAYGLVNAVVPADELAARVRSRAQQLVTQNAGQSMALTKEMIAKVQGMSLTSALEYAAETNAIARGTDDCRKGVAAFLDKKKISW